MVRLVAKEVLEDIKARVPLSRIIGRHVKLTYNGREHLGLSPFNEEKTPSFTVNDAKGFYHCFSSGKHGDALQFLMDIEGLSFGEAVGFLAQEAGVELESRDRDSRMTRAYAACGFAAQYFEQMLASQEGMEAREYLRTRGVSQEAMRAFGLGWAPANPKLGDMLAPGQNRQTLRDAGLIAGSTRDVSLFRSRIMFPIHDRTGVVAGFGGRKICDEPGPKYLNSPETAIFRKGQCLYNFSRARTAAVKKRRWLIVEGYTDVIAMVEAGFPETLAPLGTAVTVDQLQETATVTRERIFIFDGDKAGLRAAERVVDLVLPEAGPGAISRFVLLPDGEDPDAFARSHNHTEIEEQLTAAIGLEEMLWRRAMRRHEWAKSPEQRAALAHAILHDIDKIRDLRTREFFETAAVKRMEATFGSPRRLREYF